MAFNCSLPEALSDMEQAMPGFARWLYRTTRRELGEHVLDAGAGIGTYTKLMQDEGKRVVALESDARFVDEMRRRFASNPLVSVHQGDLANAGALGYLPEFDSVLCLNVLEHIEDDVQAMRNLREKVRPGGTLVALVPAYPWLFNKIDRSVGHYRRYRKSELLQKLAAARWTVRRCFRYNAVGILGWFVAGSILRRDRPGRDLERIYEMLVPVFAFLERRVTRGVIGLSLVAVCRAE